MKKLLLLLPFSLFILVSCNKEEAPQPAPQEPEFEFTLVDQNGDIIDLKEMGLSPEDLQTDADMVVTTRSNNISANGNFESYLAPVSFSAMQNNGGIHGEIDFNGSFFNFEAETSCITVIGDKAVVSGEITQVNNGPFFLREGDYVAFGVWDKGEGNNAPADQYFGAISFDPTQIDCSTSDLITLFELLPWYWFNVTPGDQIQVK